MAAKRTRTAAASVQPVIHESVNEPASDAKPAAKVRTGRGGSRMRVVRGASMRSSFFGGLSGFFSKAVSYFEAATVSVRHERATDPGPNGANGAFEMLRTSSRWMYVNDSVYRQACRQVANNVVGYGIKPIIKDKVLRKLWKRWVKESDPRGRLDFYAQQWVVVGVFR